MSQPHLRPPDVGKPANASPENFNRVNKLLSGEVVNSDPNSLKSIVRFNENSKFLGKTFERSSVYCLVKSEEELQLVEDKFFSKKDPCESGHTRPVFILHEDGVWWTTDPPPTLN